MQKGHFEHCVDAQNTVRTTCRSAVRALASLKGDGGEAVPHAAFVADPLARYSCMGLQHLPNIAFLEEFISGTRRDTP